MMSVQIVSCESAGFSAENLPEDEPEDEPEEDPEIVSVFSAEGALTGSALTLSLALGDSTLDSGTNAGDTEQKQIVPSKLDFDTTHGELDPSVDAKNAEEVKDERPNPEPYIVNDLAGAATPSTSPISPKTPLLGADPPEQENNKCCCSVQ